jgi:XTP/dITP diphosphohydrolase
MTNLKLLVATHNPGKVLEYAQMLRDFPVACISLDEAGIDEDVAETGATFEENARIKAIAYCNASGLITLADDSGLAVDALDGEPGVYSARYAGPGKTDRDRYELLLKNLEGVPGPQRTAHFRCVIVVATPEGRIYSAEGKVDGMIAYEARGENGFGYDPVFFMPQFGGTMAELGAPVKNTISHRARALQAIMPTLIEVVRARM